MTTWTRIEEACAACETHEARVALLSELFDGLQQAYQAMEVEHLPVAHKAKALDAIDTWLRGDGELAPPLTDHDRAEVERLKDAIQIHAYEAELPGLPGGLLCTRSDVQIGGWRGTTRWEYCWADEREWIFMDGVDWGYDNGRSIHTPPEISDEVAEAIPTTLGDAPLAYLLYLVAFDHVHVEDHNDASPDWEIEDEAWPPRINLNTASAEELTRLEKVSQKRALAIIADRDANGPFASLDDVTRVPGIGRGTVAQWRNNETAFVEEP